MKKDIATKEILRTITQDIAYYLLHLSVKDITFIDKELNTIEKREADVVAHCTINDVTSILHLEIQNNNDNTMIYRMLRYYTDIKRVHCNKPVHQYIIYIGKEKLRMQAELHTDKIDYAYTIIDMHSIDCEKLMALNTPDALVLAVLCDFKGKPEVEVLFNILTKLKSLTGEDLYAFGKYNLALEILSDNRNLKPQLKEAETMLRTVKFEDLPSYELAVEAGTRRGITLGISQGISQGINQGKLEAAKVMIQSLGLSAELVAEKLGIDVELLKHSLTNA